MNISIKSHIIENFKEDTEESIKEAIIESVKDTDEVVLPGLGVFLSLAWEKADENLKDSIVKLIREKLDELTK